MTPLHATRAAVQEGIVAGGGVALIRALKELEGLELDNLDQTTGVKIVYNAIQAPLRTIVENAGGEASVVVNAVVAGKDDYGFNAASGEYVNMFKAGIIDPTKVTRLALENAASIASLLLTTECVVADQPEEEGAAPAMPGGGMPGGMGGMM